jgi:predicted double-glycine peptidase
VGKKGRFPRALVLVASVLALVTGSAAGGRALTAPHAPRLVPVPLISQASPWTCGPAALMAVLVYFGVFDDAESRLDAELGATPEDGTRVRELVAAARRFGLLADARTSLELDDLKDELARGAVVIVAMQAWSQRTVTDWRSHWEDGHYVVVVGVSDDRVYFMDPSVRTGYAYLPRADFVDRWHDYDFESGRKVFWNRLGIVIRGGAGMGRYPAEPTPVQ